MAEPTTGRLPTSSTTAARPPRLPVQLSIDCCVLICKMAAALMPMHPPLFALFFDPSHFALTGERIDDSECDPDGLRPSHGVGERRRQD